MARRAQRLSTTYLLLLLGLMVAGLDLIGASAGLAYPERHSSPSRGGPPCPPTFQTAESSEAERELVELARALRQKGGIAAYKRLEAFAQRHARDAWGPRAALALGYQDYTQRLHALAQRWLKKAEADPTLQEYALYWGAQATRALGRPAEALAQLENLRRDFPASVQTELIVQALAETALALWKTERALAALDGYDKSSTVPVLLLLRARALEQEGQTLEAASAYSLLYYQFPLADEAQPAGRRLQVLARALGEKFPAASAPQRLARAQAFFDARRWREARAEFAKLATQLSGGEAELARLRVAQCRTQLGAGPVPLARLSLGDAELDAERLYALSQQRRARDKEAEMLAAIEQGVARAPASRWAEEALVAAGNYFWVKLDRARAVEFYRRLLERFPSGANARGAQWRTAWWAYLERRDDAPALLEEHLRRFPGSPNTADALYWLGRSAERVGNAPHARTFYIKLLERLPQSYFGQQAAARLRQLGLGPTNPTEVVAFVPAPPPVPQLDEPVPPAAAPYWQRAQALRSIAFDASAELELRAGYATTGAPRLLLEAARTALDAGKYQATIVMARQAAPQLEARRFEEVPETVWRVVYPLPHENAIRQQAARAGVDPMLVAGLIRQESIFQREAVSRAGAVGLMQVLPKTGRQLARQLRLGYSRARLTQAEYNLRLGTKHLADLLNDFDTLEKALAAYNAGAHRVGPWLAERNYEEPAEFVESIPFTETRDYVQTVMRNAEIYRRLYGSTAGGSKP